MKKILIIISLIIIISILVVREKQRIRPSGPVSEGCIFCHDRVKDPDPSHPVSAFGCYTCHLGNPYSMDKKRAHFSMIRNPGDLRTVDRTCGKSSCHSEIVPRVKNSIMATNRGILKTIQYHWSDRRGEQTRRIGVRDLMGENSPKNLAVDHFRKMCGGCHLWKKKGDRKGEVGRRGGGCSDCHVLDEDKKSMIEGGEFDHPKMTTRIPSKNCVKCHNRSARMGLSYFGRFESARYGTPYKGRGLTGRRLSGNRFFLDLIPDIHFSKAGMECIDCHTSTGLMGDGKRYDEMESQVDITCRACHSPSFSKVTSPESLADRLVFLNKKVPKIRNRLIGLSKKETPLYNLQKTGDKLFFFRKMDGYAIEMDLSHMNDAYHRLQGHERLSCQACHSPWIPQCYGCHLTYKKSQRQRDWISGEESPGRWKETRSYLRFSRPALGFLDASRIFPVSPCQVFVSVFDKADRYQKYQSFKVLTMSAFDPHTTSKKSRSCLECHGDPKVLGLGEGILQKRDGKLVFRPTYDPASSGLGVSFSLDAFVSPEGGALQSTSRKESRPFNKQEIESILQVNTCLGCHNRYDDKIYRNFDESRSRFEREAGIPCKRR